MPITSKNFSCHKKIIRKNYLNLPIGCCSRIQKIRNGLVKKLILPLTITALTFSGCGKKQLPLEKYTPITKTDTSMFNQLNPGLKEYLDTIYIIGREDWENCHPNLRGFARGNHVYLCEDYRKETLYHEAAHTRNNYLDKIGSKFSEKWKGIAQFNYENSEIKYIYNPSKILLEVTWKDGTMDPKDGCLNPYAGESMYEDVAIFLESVVLYSQTTPEQILKRKDLENYNKKEIEGLIRLYPWYFCNSKDKRYKQKLDLLKEYNFITNIEHDNLEKNLGNLNYLLRK